MSIYSRQLPMLRALLQRSGLLAECRVACTYMPGVNRRCCHVCLSETCITPVQMIQSRNYAHEVQQSSIKEEKQGQVAKLYHDDCTLNQFASRTGAKFAKLKRYFLEIGESGIKKPNDTIKLDLQIKACEHFGICYELVETSGKSTDSKRVIKQMDGKGQKKDQQEQHPDIRHLKHSHHLGKKQSEHSEPFTKKKPLDKSEKPLLRDTKKHRNEKNADMLKSKVFMNEDMLSHLTGGKAISDVQKPDLGVRTEERYRNIRTKQFVDFNSLDLYSSDTEPEVIDNEPEVIDQETGVMNREPEVMNREPEVMDREPDSSIIPLDVINEIKEHESGDSTDILRDLVKLKHLEHEEEVQRSKIDKDRTRQYREKIVPRPPVVTIMGHVDHGKTTLLDALRKSRVVDLEFGGITQHIGAFNVQLPSGHSITFLDTPGHAAFTSMRARGAAVTDLIVLVVAAEDGVMQQTIESIRHAQAADVPIIVAINKIDKPQANVEKVKNMLSMYGVVLEEHGGEVQVVPISALKGTNLDLLQECITTLAEFLELKADIGAPVEGRIVETRTVQGHGKTATILIQKGTLRKGDILLSGTTFTKVRNILDYQGNVVTEATPAMPVEVSGWKEMPVVGELVQQYDSERKMKKVLLENVERLKEEKTSEILEEIETIRQKERGEYVALRSDKIAFYEEMFARRSKANTGTRPAIKRSIQSYLYKVAATNGVEIADNEEEEQRPKFSIIIKGDVAGSVEAIVDTLATFSSDICDLDILDSGVGPVSDKDTELAATFDAEIYAFNVDASSYTASDEKKVVIKKHNVIYHMFHDLVDSINDRLPDKLEEEIIGEAIVQQPFEFKENKQIIQIAGCKCMTGKLQRKKLFRLVRGDNVIFDGPIVSLKHHKDEVEIIKTEQDCGVCLTKQLKCIPGDTVICYDKVYTPQTLDWEPDFVLQV